MDENHNYYTLRGEAGACTAFNNVRYDLLWESVLHKPRWANVLVLTSAEGETIARPAELVFMRSNPKRGNLRALYRAEFTLPEGKTYVSVGLGEDEKTLYSEASVRYAEAGACLVTAVITLTLSPSVSSIAPCAGDNPLVARLLGCGPEGEVNIAYGTCDYPSCVMPRGAALLDKGATPAIRVDESGATLSSPPTSTGYRDVILKFGDVPALRILREDKYQSYYLNTKAISGANAVVGEVVSVTNAQANGVPYDEVDFCARNDYAFDMGDEPVAVGVSGDLQCDPNEEYLAVVTHDAVTVYDVRNYACKQVYTTPHRGEHVFLCNGGSVLLWNSSTLKIHEPQADGQYTVTTVALGCGNLCYGVREGAYYHVAMLSGTSFARYRISGSSYTALSPELGVDPDKAFLGRCGQALCCNTTAFGVYRLSGIMYSEYKAGSVTKEAGDTVSLGDTFLCRVVGDRTEFYTFVKGGYKRYVGVFTANGRVAYSTDAILFYDYFGNFTLLQGDYARQNIQCACISGNYLFVINDGVLRRYYLNGRDVTVIRTPVWAVGKTITANLMMRVYENTGITPQFVLAKGE